MNEYTIRDCETGAVICTGYTAENETDAEDNFYCDNPNYDGDVYAAVSNWND